MYRLSMVIETFHHRQIRLPTEDRLCSLCPQRSRQICVFHTLKHADLWAIFFPKIENIYKDFKTEKEKIQYLISNDTYFYIIPYPVKNTAVILNIRIKVSPHKCTNTTFVFTHLELWPVCWCSGGREGVWTPLPDAWNSQYWQPQHGSRVARCVHHLAGWGLPGPQHPPGTQIWENLEEHR